MNRLEFEPAVLLTDGVDSFSSREQVLQSGAQLKESGVHLSTVALGFAADRELLRNLATTASDSYAVRDPDELLAIFDRIALRLDELFVQDIVVQDTLPSNMQLVQDSASPPIRGGSGRPGDPLEWRFASHPSSGMDLTVQVRPQDIGQHETNLWARAVYTDSEGRWDGRLFEVPKVEVLEPPEPATVPPTLANPSSTPTSTLGATATPTLASPSPTASPTIRLTPTPTPSHAPATKTSIAIARQTAYLPVLFRNACFEIPPPTDVVLVLDTSTSMRQEDSPGKQRLDVAAEAISAFVGAREKVGDNQRIALVTFNHSARRCAGAKVAFCRHWFVKRWKRPTSTLGRE